MEVDQPSARPPGATAGAAGLGGSGGQATAGGSASPGLSGNAASAGAAPAATALPDTPTTAANQNSSATSHPSFRRQRASRACETCHARKVRCDAASLGVPCTNCVAFNIECHIPSPKRKKTNAQSSAASVAGNVGTGSKDSDSDRDAPDERPLQTGRATTAAPSAAAAASAATSAAASAAPPGRPAVHHTPEATPPSMRTESQARKDADANKYLSLLLKPRFTRAPITEAGRVAYLGESSNLTLLVHDQTDSSDVVHYPLPENVRGSHARLLELDKVELDVLQQRGAFLLPPRELCDELIEAYFAWIHPIMPVINRTRFMRQYNDVNNPPSLLLLQAILLAGSRVCKNPKLMDVNGSTTPAALTFYKRAKALYDANYEDDRVTIVQSLLLMGWYWEGPEDVTKNVFYWSRVATIVAQGSGMHRSVESSQLSTSDKRLWKRIWWTLFTRDRSVAVALGRPVHINLEDSDVEMLTEEDFNEDEPDQPSGFPPDPLHVQFFLQYVKLCEIMSLVLSQQYSVASKGLQKNPIDLTHSDMALADWLQNCPRIVCWNIQSRSFWSALLFSNYYTTLCLLHRAYMPPASSSHRFHDDIVTYPSRNIAFHAAGAITSIIEYLAASSELRYCPAFIVYSLFSALIMHVYQLRSPVPSIQQVTQENLRTCMGALKEVSKVWLVGKMVYALFESILGNKVFEERLRKAGGVRHRKMMQSFMKPEGHGQPGPMHMQQALLPPDAGKRKFDEMNIEFGMNTPQPQESYERSRPQTPSHGGMKAPVIPAGGMRQSMDAFMGGAGSGGSGTGALQGNGTANGAMSRPQTRPHTPFTAPFSVPATPPDLYLVTRNSPNLSQSIWENFQPDQLFPDSTGLSTMFPTSTSPTATGQSLDPNLVPQSSQTSYPPHMSPPPANAPTTTKPPTSNAMSPGTGALPQASLASFQRPSGQQQPANGGVWQAALDGALPDGQSPSDSWSTGSAQGQSVPSTLNVEDWFQFFGINGDANGLNLDLSSL